MKKSEEKSYYSDSTFSVENTTPSSGSLDSIHTSSPDASPVETPEQTYFANFLVMLDKNTKNEKRQSIGNEAMYNLFCTDSISSKTFLSNNLNNKKGLKEVPKICLFPLNKVAIFLSILTAIFVTLIIGSIIGYVFTSSLSTNKNWKTIGYFISFALIHQALTALFILGIIKDRSKWLLPLLFITIVFFIASLGVLITLIITLDSDIHEVIRRANNADVEHKIGIQEIFIRIFILRLFILFAVTYQLAMTVVYTRIYRHMTKKE